MKAIILFLGCGCLWSQPLTVYSELARVDKSGVVTAPETPREILSPMVIRNGFTSFQVVVQAPAGKHWELHVGQNPENAVTVTVYREFSEPFKAVDLPVAGDGPAVFWMDVWTARDAPVRRIKVEPELNIDDDWVIYPMEARVMEAIAPDGAPGAVPSGDFDPPLEWSEMRNYVCDFPRLQISSAAGTRSGISPWLSALRLRNVRQDIRLSEAYSAKAEATKLWGSCDAKPTANFEWYLRIRDYLFRLR